MPEDNQLIWTYASDVEDDVYLVEARTGVEYAEQVSGHYCMANRCEGFLVPIASNSTPLREFFRRFGGGGPTQLSDWQEGWADDLADVVAGYRSWEGMQSLQLDVARLSETTEAWVRVLTPYGPGVLVFPNSD